MLIDAAHPEEIRVAVVEDKRLVAFDYDATQDGQLSGNIYLARIVRIEPALQAAFVDFGGQRHGFLALSEIHPDYFQIPDGDRQSLLETESGKPEEEDQEERRTKSRSSRSRRKRKESDPASAAGEDVAESVDGEEIEEEIDDLAHRQAAPRDYSIEEVVRSRQILLVQVYKEPRGNKGAVLTTYISLAGRYCVLMPNTARGGGISRKIGSQQDRKRLRAIAQELDVAPGLGVIIRTAGSGRTKAEIKRDYAALLRQWEAIRKATLNSFAPCLVHEEGSLIRRAVRDLYDKDIKQILIEGEEAYRDAKDYMRLLTPSHARNVQMYREEIPIFVQHEIEGQLDRLFQPDVALPSGGSIVIHCTEALTAIDVNSGRQTSERTVEKTALRTNLEAADEVALQLSLRDIAGLIVIDFIDMDVKRNRRSVESRLKDRLKIGRARVQLGEISAFGLLEMSRQRMRKGMLEISTAGCPRCDGTGRVRSDRSLALSALRKVEEEARSNANQHVILRATIGIANYLANEKRKKLSEIETTRDIHIRVETDGTAQPSAFELVWQGDSSRPQAEAGASPPAPQKTRQERGRGGRSRTDRPRRRNRGRGRTTQNSEDASTEKPKIAQVPEQKSADSADRSVEEGAAQHQ